MGNEDLNFENTEKSYSSEVSMLAKAITDAGLDDTKKVIEDSIDKEAEIEKIALELFSQSHPEHEIHDIISAYYGQQG